MTLVMVCACWGITQGRQKVLTYSWVSIENTNLETGSHAPGLPSFALLDWDTEAVSSRSRRSASGKGGRISLPHSVTAKCTLTFVIWTGLMKCSERSFRLQKGLESMSQSTQQRGHSGFQSSVITRHNKDAGAVSLPQVGKNPLLRL